MSTPAPSGAEIAEKLIHPDDVGYLCHQFGDCCREQWTVPVSLEEAEGLARRVAEGGWEEQLRGLPPTVAGAAGTPTFARHGRDCVFLAPDNRCSLHARHGADAKPDICRLFPYLFTETPDGVVVGYSFVCRTVRENLSPGAHAPAAELAETLARARREGRIHLRRAAAPILFAPGRSLGWSGYLALEGAARRLLVEEQLPLPRRLVALDVLGSLLAGYFKARGAADWQEHDAATLDFTRQMEADAFRTVIRLARLAEPSRLIYRSLSPLLILLSPGRPASRTGALRDWLRLFLQPLPRAGREREWSPDESAPVARYLAHVLARKDLLCGNPLHALGGVRRGLVVLALLFCLIRYHRTRLLADWSPAEATAEAILRVERGFGPHARFRADGISTHAAALSLLWRMVDNVMGRKRFVPSMVLSA